MAHEKVEEWEMGASVEQNADLCLFPLCCRESLWCCFTSCHPSTKTVPAAHGYLGRAAIPSCPRPPPMQALRNALFQPSGCSWIFQKEMQAGGWALKGPVGRGDGGTLGTARSSVGQLGLQQEKELWG